jgi:enoyl-CoA hydratase/carnithine racemase
MSMEFETLAVRREDGALFVMITAPPMNLMGSAMVGDLVSLIQQAEADASVHVLVFRSGDPDYFIAHAEMAFGRLIGELGDR